MKNYGNVKGWVYRNAQPVAESRTGKKKCPKCRCWKPESEFIGRDRMPKRFCKKCRSTMGRKF